jgi:hypothetical protein
MNLKKWKAGNLSKATLNFGGFVMTGVHPGVTRRVSPEKLRLGRIAQAKAGGHTIISEQPPGDTGTRKDLRNRKADTWPSTKSYTAIVNIYEEAQRVRQPVAPKKGEKRVTFPTKGAGKTVVTQEKETPKTKKEKLVEKKKAEKELQRAEEEVMEEMEEAPAAKGSEYEKEAQKLYMKARDLAGKHQWKFRTGARAPAGYIRAGSPQEAETEMKRGREVFATGYPGTVPVVFYLAPKPKENRAVIRKLRIRRRW